MAASGGSSSANSKTVGSALTAPRSARNPASIFFELRDEEGEDADVQLLFDDGDGFAPITLAAGSRSLRGIETGGDRIEVLWDFEADLGSSAFVDGLSLRLVVEGGLSPDDVTGVVMGNDAPVLTALEATPTGQVEYAANTDLEFELSDSADDPLEITVEFNDDATNGFPDEAWRVARPAGTPGADTTPETVRPEPLVGSRFAFRWDTLFDLAGFDGEVRVRVQPSDGFDQGADQRTTLRVDNNGPPLVVPGEGAFLSGAKRRGVIPIPMQVFDNESDDVNVLVQWRRSDEVFPDLPTDPAQLQELLDDPTRAGERDALRVAREKPRAFLGRFGLEPNPAPRRLRLPELASSAAALLGHGLDGRVLEILQPSRRPVPFAWNPNPLNAPVALLAGGDGRTALVLDATSGGGWRVREIELHSGSVEREIQEGPGSPLAMSRAPNDGTFFVASSAGFFRMDEAGAFLKEVSVPSSARGILALGGTVLLVTTGSSLLRIDLSSDPVASNVLVTDLREPWGLVRHPSRPASVVVAERAANRLTIVDLGTLALEAVAVEVLPDDVAELGPLPLPGPSNLAFEDGGRGLLVLCEAAGQPSLRRFAFGTAVDIDFDTDPGADPIVEEVAAGLGDAEGGVAAGPNGERYVVLPSQDLLALGGSVVERVEIEASAGDPDAYRGTDQTVRLARAVDDLAPGTPWRIRVPARGTGAPGGRKLVFNWDSSEVPDAESVQMRVLSWDADLGTAVEPSGFKEMRTRFRFDDMTLVPGFPLLHGDVDGDGDVDLAGSDDGLLMLQRQTAPGVFTAETIADVTVHGVVDLEGDGDLDFFGREGASVVLVVQDPPGTFSTSDPLAVGNLQQLWMGDLDGDGDADLVGDPTFPSDSVQVFRQNALDDFEVVGPALAKDGLPLVIADVDSDGRPDLATLLSSDQPVVYFQGAALQFEKVELSPATGPFTTQLTSLVVGDLDGDGDADIAVSDLFSNSRIVRYRQLEPRVFERALPDIKPGDDPDYLTLGDFDGDGDNDLVNADPFNRVRTHYQVEPGEFVTATGATENEPLPAGTVTVVDLNADQVPDLLSSDASELFGQSASRWSALVQTRVGFHDAASFPLPGGASASGAAVADVDGDGFEDIVVGLADQTRALIATQSSPGVFVADRELSFTTAQNGVAAADFDGDGLIDVAVSVRSLDGTPFDGGIELRLQQPTGEFGPVQALPGPPLDRLIAVDVSGDGLLDLVAAPVAGDDLSLYRQSAPGQFDAPATIASGPSPVHFEVADIDADGRVDLAVVNDGSNNVTLLMQQAGGGFATTNLPAVEAQAVHVVELDGDGDLDLVVRRESGLSNSFDLWLQSDTGTFELTPGPAAIFSLQGESFAADLDGDGRAEIVFQGAWVFEQVVPGHFGPPVFLPVDDARLVLDADGDGDLDLAGAPGFPAVLKVSFNGD